MPATSLVTHYGVHWAPGKLAYLHQGRGATNAVGVREQSPFEVRTARRWMCNHLIALNAVNSARGHLVKFEELISKNPLVRFMLLVPKGAGASSALLASRSHEQDLLQVALLLKMSSPIKLPVFWANVANTQTLVSELGMTNVQPLVLAGVTVEHTAMARDVCREAALSPRRLLVIAHPDVTLPGEIDGRHLFEQDEVDLAALHWETLGSLVLRGHMRGEWDGSWFTREPIPGNESKDAR